MTTQNNGGILNQDAKRKLIAPIMLRVRKIVDDQLDKSENRLGAAITDLKTEIRSLRSYIFTLTGLVMASFIGQITALMWVFNKVAEISATIGV